MINRELNDTAVKMIVMSLNNLKTDIQYKKDLITVNSVQFPK
ncbi:unnamed protein product, partial [marine sediment metagenome]